MKIRTPGIVATVLISAGLMLAIPAVAQTTPSLVATFSRHTHTGAGDFDLQLGGTPTVLATVPAANTAYVDPNTTVTLMFSERVNVFGAWFQMACTSGTRTPANTAVTGDSGTSSGKTFVLTPNVTFDFGDACAVTIHAAGIADVNDPLHLMANDFVFTFTVRTNSGIFDKPLPWNKDVSALPASPRSDAIITALEGMGGWGNGNKLQIDFSIALLFADSTTPRRTITASPGGYCFGGPDCDPVPLQMPIPANGNTEGSPDYTCDVANEDCHVLVVERTERKLYELYNATAVGPTVFTATGAFVWDLTKQYPPELRGDQCTSADAAGLPIAALLPTADEVASGVVPHALRFILPNPRMKADVFVHPATHAGGPSSADPNAPPYGVRFRLNASFDETPYNANARVILQAMKTYGMILSDGGNIALTFGDDRLATAKWATLGIDSHTFNSIGVGNFDVVDLGAEIPLTYDCVRAP
jgi:Bacterial Ig-like domain